MARTTNKSLTHKPIRMTAAQQLAFWTTLRKRAKLTPAQKELSRLMRGVA